MKLTYKNFCLLFFASTILCLHATAQIDNLAMEDRVRVSAEDTNKLMLHFKFMNFLNNTEYFHRIATGYTLFGSELSPRLSYMPNQYMRIDGGIYIRKDFGNPLLTMVAPTLSMKFQKNGYSFIFGNLEASLNHRLIEPLFNYERVIFKPLENGIQFGIDKNKLWLDTWLDWEQQEYKNSSFKEHIGAGLNAKITLIQMNDIFKVQLPIQAFIFHHGGQIDKDTSNVLSLGNAASGLIVDLDLTKNNGFITGIRNDNYILGYKDISFTKSQPYKLGDGLYLNIMLKTKYHINLQASYWQGHDFISPHGGFLYQSVSSEFNIKTPPSTEDDRRLLFVRLMYQHEMLPDLFIDVRMEPYYDLNNHFMEFGYRVFASYRRDIDLGKVKKYQ